MIQSLQPSYAIQMDLGHLNTMSAMFRHKLHHAASPGAAMLAADWFFDAVEGVFKHDLRPHFQAEVDYLWTAFPQRSKTFQKYKELLQVLVGQTIEVDWYGDYPRYASARAIPADPSLCCFRRFHTDFNVKFAYVQYYGHPLMRFPNALRLRYRRIINHPGRYTQGLTITYCTRAIAALINHIAEAVEQECGQQAPSPLLVNSILRTVDYQQALARIGYIAPRFSSHLAGYAVDIEATWYRNYDRRTYRAIEQVLASLVKRQEINLINEGTHWHVCLHPAYNAPYAALLDRWAKVR